MNKERSFTSSSSWIRAVAYVICAMIPFLFLEWQLAHLPNLYSLKAATLKARASDIQVLVLGGCDAQAAFKPSAWKNPGFNLASANQSPVVSSQLFLKWESELPRLKTILLSTSYFAWQSYLPLGDEYWRNYFYFRLWGIRGELDVFRFLDIRGASLFFLYWPYSKWVLFNDNVPSYSPLITERMPFLQSLPEDGYLPFDRSTARTFDEQQVLRSTELLHRSLRAELQIPNMTAVRTMLTRARQRGIRVYFVKTPVAPVFGRLMSPNLGAKEDEMLATFALDYGSSVLDFRKPPGGGPGSWPQWTDSDFADPAHLSAQGAAKLSEFLVRLVDGAADK